MSRTKLKRSHSFDAEAADAIDQFADGNRSAYVNQAVLERAQRDRVLAFLDDFDEEVGPVSDVNAAAGRLSYFETLAELAERRTQAAREELGNLQVGSD